MPAGNVEPLGGAHITTAPGQLSLTPTVKVTFARVDWPASELSRSDGGHRNFDEGQREKLQLIMDLREAGLSIQDIKDLFALKGSCATPDEASARMAKTLECSIGEMQRKIAVLRRLREELASMVTVIRECETCESKDAFPKRCGDCDVMARPDLPRAMRLLWSK